MPALLEKLIILLSGPLRFTLDGTGPTMDDREYAEVLRRAMQELTEQFAHRTDIDATLRGVTANSVDLIEVWNLPMYYWSRVLTFSGLSRQLRSSQLR